MLELENELEEAEEVSVEVPTLPSGRRLTIDILSTWGDVYYAGLTGVELFDGDGRPVPLGPAQVCSNRPL